MQAETTTGPSRLPFATLNMIVAAFLARFARIDEAGGEVTPEDEADLDALTPLLEHKVEAYKLAIVALKEDSAAAKRIADSYALAAKRKAAHAERLHDRLYRALKAAQRDHVSTPTATASIQLSPAKLVLDKPLDELPLDVVKVERSANTAAIKSLLTSGAALDYAHLEQGEHLRIR